MNKFEIRNIYIIFAFKNRKLSNNNMKNFRNNYVTILLENSII